MHVVPDAPDPGSFADDPLIRLALTGAPQRWIAQCQAVIKTGSAVDAALIADDNTDWARALRGGRKWLDTSDDLAVEGQILDVRAASAIRDLTLYLAERCEDNPEAAVRPMLDHADDAQLHSIGHRPTNGSLGGLRPRGAGAGCTRLARLLNYLSVVDRPSRGYVALLACHLTQTLPPAQNATTVRALFDVRPPDEPGARHELGAAGKLTVAMLEHGPPGLHPHPGRMAFFGSSDPGFTRSTTNAWLNSPFGQTTHCVVWSVNLDARPGQLAEGPANEMSGGSLGGAFAVGLHELDALRRRRRALHRSMPLLTRAIIDLRRSVVNADSAVSATVVDPDGRLGPVSGLDNKIAAARRARVDLVVTHPSSTHTTPTDAGVSVKTADTVAAAVKLVRTTPNPRFISTLVAFGAVLAMTATVAIAISHSVRRQRAAETIVAAERILAEASQIHAENPRKALLLGEAALALNPSAAGRATLATILAHSRYAGTIPETSPVQAAAVSRDGGLVAEGTQDGRLSLYEFDHASHAHRLASASTMSPIRAMVFAGDGQALITGHADNKLRIWDTGDPRRPARMSELAPRNAARTSQDGPRGGTPPAIQDIALSQAGKLLAVASSDGSVSMWSLEELTRPETLAVIPDVPGGAWSVALGPHRHIAVGAGDGTLMIWAINGSGLPRRMFMRKLHQAAVRSIAYHPNGRSFISGSLDGTVKLWDAVSPTRPRLRETLRQHARRVFKVVYAPDGRTFASAGADRTAHLWRTAAGQGSILVASLRGHSGYIRALTYTPDSKHLLTGSLDKSLIIWDVTARAQPELLTQLPPHPDKVRALAFSPDHSLLAVGTNRGTLQLFDVADPRRPRLAQTLNSGFSPVYALAFSPDGQQLAEGTAEPAIRLWNIGDWARRPARVLTGHHRAIRALAYNRTGSVLVSGSADGSVALWEPNGSGRPRRLDPVSESMVTTVAFSADDSLLLAGGIDRQLRVWRMTDTGTAEHVSAISAHDEAIFALRYSPTGRIVAVSSYDGTTTVWSTEDLTAPRQISRFSQHTRGVRTEAFHSEGNLLATGSDDGTVAIVGLIDPVNPALLARLDIVRVPTDPTLAEGDNGVLATAFGESNLVVGTADGRTLIYDTAELRTIADRPREAACARTGEGLSVGEWNTYLPGIPHQRTCEN